MDNTRMRNVAMKANKGLPKVLNKIIDTKGTVIVR